LDNNLVGSKKNFFYFKKKEYFMNFVLETTKLKNHTNQQKNVHLSKQKTFKQTLHFCEVNRINKNTNQLFH